MNEAVDVAIIIVLGSDTRIREPFSVSQQGKTSTPFYLEEDAPINCTTSFAFRNIESTAPIIRDTERNGPHTKFWKRSRSFSLTGSHSNCLAGLKIACDTAL